MNFEIIPWLSYTAQFIHMAAVVVTMIYMLYKYRRESIATYFIFLCWPFAFIFLGKNIHDFYKVMMLLYTIYVFIKPKSIKSYSPKEIWVLLLFVLFSAQFFWAVFVYSTNSITIVFSQYSRYFETILLFFVIKRTVLYMGKRDMLLRLFYDIGLMQIIISIVKWFAFGQQVESYVGSFAVIGGEMGTTVPILWFMILWLYRRGRFSQWDWAYILGLLWVGFTTGKRAVMFILPVVVFVFMVYVQGIKLQKYMFIALAFVPILFYFGVRLTPTLNPEHKVWGSFDWEYAWGYAEEYQFGKEGVEGQVSTFQEERTRLEMTGGGINTASKQLKADGRGGATIAILKLLVGLHPTQDSDWWGTGFGNMYSTDYLTFDKLPLTIRLNHKGSATGFFQSYVTTGILGALATILLCFSYLLYFKKKRLMIVVIGICAWEYFMYTGSIFRMPAFMAVLFLLLQYTNLDEKYISRYQYQTNRPQTPMQVR